MKNKELQLKSMHFANLIAPKNSEILFTDIILACL